jgi:hypothetical protein
MRKLIIRRYKFLAVFAGLILAVSSFQNCSPPSSGGAFILGSGDPDPTCTDGVSCASGSIAVSSVLFNPNPVAPSANYSATGIYSSSDSTVSCEWQLQNADGSVNIGSQSNSAGSSGSCGISGLTAPPTSGTYRLKLTVRGSSGAFGSNSTQFTVQAGTTPTNTASAQLMTTTVVANDNKVDYHLQARIISSMPNSRVVIGYLDAMGVKQQFTTAGSMCTFTINSGGTGATTPDTCVVRLPHRSVTIYIDVSTTASAAVLSCQATTANCQGAFIIDNNAAYGCQANQDGNHPYQVSFFNDTNPSFSKVPVKNCWFGPSHTNGIPNAAGNKTAEFFQLGAETLEKPPVIGVNGTNWSAIIGAQVSLAKNNYLVTLSSDDGAYMFVTNKIPGSGARQIWRNPGTTSPNYIELNNNYANPHALMTKIMNLVNITPSTPGNENTNFDMTIFYRNYTGDAHLSVKIE